MTERQDESYYPGDVAFTAYGVGVIASCPSNESGNYRVRLWRLPGRSIGSCVVAFLQQDSLRRRLPAAPGMTTLRADGEYDGQKVMVHCYYASKNKFLVATADEDDSWRQPEGFERLERSEPTKWMELAPENLQTARSAKFYPLLDELMRRGDETAAATSLFLNQEHVADLVNKTTKIVEAKANQMADSSSSAAVISKEGVQELTESVLPDETQVKQIYSMIKDEELTVLLERGRERLQQLVSSDIPKATEEALLKTGIELVVDDDSDQTFSASIAKSQETALNALEELLKDGDIDTADIETIREKLEADFSTMFDSLRDAAQSDRTLNSIFDTISAKTSEWQEATGRLLSTKSASLFMEGAHRLQARAANMFSQDQLDWVGNIGSRFTKAFTEGDAAVARLKSVELGESVRNRLVSAIEVRSGSHGGLDGIIAGALSTIKSSGDASGNQLQDMLHSLQQTASSTTKDTHETLISMLSQRSEYKDVALVRLEEVLCNLEVSLGEDVPTDDIAAVVSGEKSTAVIFEPMARRAAQEIEKQLDAAESAVSEPTVLEVLRHVRKILSGELSVSNLLDEAINILNDDNVVSAGETLVKHSENVLDAIEGVSGNKIIETTLEVAEKAGITKDSVMKQMQSLNMDELLDTAQDAVTDEKARRDLLSSATDTALDFLLRILPSMPVPPFDGVKDGLVYHLSNLSMKGFKVKKEHIVVEIAGMRATNRTSTNQSHAAGDSGADQASMGAQESSGVDTSFSSNASVDLSIHQEVPSGSVKATELLIIDVQNISAVLEDVIWSFEQTYMPYLKGNGKANVKLCNGSIRLQFELRRRLKPEGSVSSEEKMDRWDPVLCLHERSCEIGDIDLVMQGEGKLTWILNKLAAIFRGPLRDYVVRTIVGVLTSHSGNILENLNGNLAPYWGLVLKTAGLAMEDLVEANEEVITAAVPDENDHLVELVWRENLPLGMNLLLNDDSGLLKVVDFPRGSQARKVCTDRQIDPVVFEGSTIVAVNGSRYEGREGLFDALRDPSRPKAILFEVANKVDADRIRRFVAGSDDDAGFAAESNHERRENFAVRTVKFTEGRELGLKFAASRDHFGLVVHSYQQNGDGIVYEAEKQEVRIGDLLSHVNGELVLGANGAGKHKALSLLERVGSERPLSLSFVKPYLIYTIFEKPSNSMVDIGGPSEFKLKEVQSSTASKRIVLEGFNDVPGMAESSGIMIGDHLLFINALAVGAGCRLVGESTSPELGEIYKLLREEESYPVGLTFARPKKEQQSRWTASSGNHFDVESAETNCVTADCFEDLGCVFGANPGGDIVLTDLFAVPGPIQRTMHRRIHLSIDAVNGQFLPSYASPSIVMNALKRSWSTNGSFEILFCDDARKQWVEELT